MTSSVVINTAFVCSLPSSLWGDRPGNTLVYSSLRRSVLTINTVTGELDRHWGPKTAFSLKHLYHTLRIEILINEIPCTRELFENCCKAKTAPPPFFQVPLLPSTCFCSSDAFFLPLFIYVFYDNILPFFISRAAKTTTHCLLVDGMIGPILSVLLFPF